MDIFQEVKDRVSTIDAAQQYGLILHRKGTTHWSLCPFHPDKKPSLAIFQDDGFKCFSCGTGGADSITFTARLFKLSMIKAAKKLVDDFSIPGFDPTGEITVRSDPEGLAYSTMQYPNCKNILPLRFVQNVGDSKGKTILLLFSS